MTGVASPTAPPSVRLLTLGKVADQGSIFLASVLVAAAIGPARFAPVGVVLVLGSLAVQLSDLGLGFSMHARPLVARVPIGNLRRMRGVGVVVVASAAVASLVLGNPLAFAGGCIWMASADAYVRKAVALRAGAAGRVVTAEIAGSVVVLASGLAAAAAGSVGLLVVGLVAKHLVEVAAVPWPQPPERAEPLRTGTAWWGQAATYAASNADYLVVGLLLPPAAFSAYVLAFRVVSALPSLVAGALTQRTFVDLAGRADDAALRDLHDSVPSRVAPLAAAGVAVGIAAAVVVRVGLGEDWNVLLPIAAVLALAVPFRLALGITVATAVSAGAARLVVRTEILRLAAAVLFVTAGCAIGVVPAALGAASATAGGVLLLRRAVGIAVGAGAQPVRS